MVRENERERGRESRFEELKIFLLFLVFYREIIQNEYRIFFLLNVNNN